MSELGGTVESQLPQALTATRSLVRILGQTSSSFSRSALFGLRDLAPARSENCRWSRGHVPPRLPSIQFSGKKAATANPPTAAHFALIEPQNWFPVQPHASLSTFEAALLNIQAEYAASLAIKRMTSLVSGIISYAYEQGDAPDETTTIIQL